MNGIDITDQEMTILEIILEQQGGDELDGFSEVCFMRLEDSGLITIDDEDECCVYYILTPLGFLYLQSKGII